MHLNAGAVHIPRNIACGLSGRGAARQPIVPVPAPPVIVVTGRYMRRQTNERFLPQIANMLDPCTPRVLLIWDGAPQHRTHAVRRIASHLGIEVLPLPAYQSAGSDIVFTYPVLPIPEAWNDQFSRCEPSRFHKLA